MVFIDSVLYKINFLDLASIIKLFFQQKYYTNIRNILLNQRFISLCFAVVNSLGKILANVYLNTKKVSKVLNLRHGFSRANVFVKISMKENLRRLILINNLCSESIMFRIEEKFK